MHNPWSSSRLSQQGISRIEEAVIELRKDVDKLKSLFNFGQRMSDFAGFEIVKKAGDDWR